MKLIVLVLNLIVFASVHAMDVPQAPAFQYDASQSNLFWLAARKGDLDTLKSMHASNPRICFNFQQQFKDSYVQTALDWPILQNNEPIVQWLVDMGAWSFKSTQDDFKQKFPKLSQRYDGKKSFEFWRAAEKNQFNDMKDLLDWDSSRNISVNLLRKNKEGLAKTALDFAVEHKNEAMAKLIINKAEGANTVAMLCFFTPQEFQRAFPNLWELTPPGKAEKAMMENSPEYSQTYALSKYVAEPALIRSEALDLADSVYQNFFHKEFNQKFAEERDEQIKEYHIRKNILERKSEIEELESKELEQLIDAKKLEYKAKKQKKDDIGNREKNERKDYFAGQALAQWSADKVRIWLERVVPAVEDYNLYIAGNDLGELTRRDLSHLPMGKRAKLFEEIQNLKAQARKNQLKKPSDKNFLMSSNYKRVNRVNNSYIMPEQIFADYREFLDLYCQKKGVNRNSCNDFYTKLELEIMEKLRQFDKNPETKHHKCIYLTLWVSSKYIDVNRYEFSTILCDTLRFDDHELLESAAPLVKGITSSLNYKPKHWPIDRRLYRGSCIGPSQLPLLVPGSRFRYATFLASSEKEKIAKMFLNRVVNTNKNIPEGAEKLVPAFYYIELPEPGKMPEGCNLVGRLGKYGSAGEVEFLFPPYTVFKVKKVEEIPANPSIDTPIKIWLEAEVEGSLYLPVLKYN